MKIMGIDYGTKRIGIAFSDDSGSVAFPAEVISNKDNLNKKRNCKITLFCIIWSTERWLSG